MIELNLQHCARSTRKNTLTGSAGRIPRATGIEGQSDLYRPRFHSRHVTIPIRRAIERLRHFDSYTLENSRPSCMDWPLFCKDSNVGTSSTTGLPGSLPTTSGSYLSTVERSNNSWELRMNLRQTWSVHRLFINFEMKGNDNRYIWSQGRRS